MDRIGEYLVRRMVGEGGMGKVYEAEERLSHRRVALKVLRPELARSENGRQMFLNEMAILAQLDHPNIVRSLACTEEGGELVMALEYLEGDTLRQRLATRGKLPWQDAVAIASAVASALTAAHGQDPPIVHRDLKPENLMLLPDDRVKVMDFGIGKVMQAIRKSTTHSVGTLQYMSPEQIDAGHIDQRSDLYSLGLIFYEMLAGTAPFTSESPRELLNLQCTSAPPALPDDVRGQLPRGVERLLLRLLEKSPANRPASAAEVVEALEPFAVGARPAEPPRRTPASSASMPAVEPAPADKLNGHRAGPAARGALPVEPAPQLDTVALIQRAGKAREIAPWRSAAIIAAVCVVTAIATYFVRAGWPGS
jgi:serine/threonine protein kinase